MSQSVYNFAVVERDALAVLDAASTLCGAVCQTAQIGAFLLGAQMHLVTSRIGEALAPGFRVVSEYHGTHVEMIRTDTGETVAMLGAHPIQEVL